MKITFHYGRGVTLAAMLLSLSLGGCAAGMVNNPEEVPAMHSINEFKDQRFAEVEDPWEGFNRSMYRFNFNFDKYIFLPVVSSYEFIKPTFVRSGYRGCTTTSVKCGI